MVTQNPENNGPDLDADDNVNPESQSQGQDETPSLNPAWNPLLEVLPDDYHVLATPILQSWDKNFQDKVNSLQADLENYSDWDEFVDNDVDPEQAKAALMFAVRLEEDPKGTIEGLAKHFGIDLSGGSAQGTKTSADLSTGDTDLDDLDLDDLPDDLAKHPVIQQLVESQQQLNEQLQSRENESLIAQYEQQLDEYLEELHEDYGDFHEPFVLALFQNGYEMEEAVEYFQANFPNWKEPTEDGEQSQQAPAKQGGFVPMGNGGSNVGGGVPVPSSNNYGDMSKSDLNSVVAKIAAAMDDKDS